ncbi:MAG: hypothetical protein E7260_03515 [Lachnospiraceae bacterium]|nr:hypothetical protein [Lachnospiraceae bacterium]
MTNQEVETKVAQAFEGIVPDMQEKILDRCYEQKGTVIPLPQNTETKYRKLKTYAAYAAGIAAGLMLMIGGLSGLKMYRANYIVDSTVSLDVNPSVEIKVNQKAVVLEVVPRNEDAEIIIGEMDFKGSSLEVTLNALVGSMLKNGYLNEIANSILVSIDGGDDEHSLELQAKIAEDIENTLLAQEFNAAVLCQTIKPTDELKELAETHDVSVGKAQLIQEIANQNDQYTFEDLATLSINELSLLTESSEITLEGVSSVGTSSKEAYIEEGVAIDVALTAAGLDVTADLAFEEFECELEYESGKMVYEIEFIYNDNKHEYDVDALTGELVNSEVTPVEKPEPTAAPTATATPAPTATNTPTPEPTATNTPTPVPTATNTPTPIPTAEPTVEPTQSIEPLATPGAEPSGKPGKDPKPSEHPQRPEDLVLLTEEQVKEIVLGHLAIAADLIDDFEIRLVNNRNNHFYMIKFEVGDVDYTYKIDAVTGEITVAESEPDDDDDKDDQKPEDKEERPQLPGWPTDYEFPTTDELKEMVLAHAAIAEDAIDDFEVRFVNNKNNMFFMIKFEVGDTDFTYKINALTGEIHVSDSETDENDEEADETEDETPENPWDNWKDWFDEENWKDWSDEETPEHWGNWEDWQNWEGWQEIKPEDWMNPENWPQFPELKPGTNPDEDAAESLLTSEQIKEIVLTAATLTEDVIEDYEERLVNNRNNKFFQIKLETETAKYTYKVDAVTGEILSSEVDNKEENNKNPWGDWTDWTDWFDHEDDDENEDDGSEDDEGDERWDDWFDWMNPDNDDDVDDEEDDEEDESGNNKNNSNKKNER